jgi:hypothetical protein
MPNKIIHFCLVCLVVIVICQPTLACSCGPTPLDNTQFNKAYTFMIGEIVEITKGKRYGNNDTLFLKVKVEKSWKQKTGRLLTLPLFDAKDFCGDLEPVVGKKYFLRTFMPRGWKENLAIWGDCGLSRLLEQAQDDLTFLAKKAYWSYSH